jgi:hypothetical protein
MHVLQRAACISALDRDQYSYVGLAAFTDVRSCCAKTYVAHQSSREFLMVILAREWFFAGREVHDECRS